MLAECNLIYRYDGSFDGLMCCAFESFEKREMPQDVVPPGGEYLSLFGAKQIGTDRHKAARVKNWIGTKLSPLSLDLCSDVMLTCLEEKELYILKYLHLCHAEKRCMAKKYDNAIVNKLFAAVRHLGNEAQHLRGFVRFSDHSGVLVSEIAPKNFVLPILLEHFADRFPSEAFMIYDKTHKQALLYAYGKSDIVPLEHFEKAAPDAAERHYRALWRQFYDSIGIKQRKNHKLRMSFMAKRFWPDITEMNREDEKLQIESAAAETAHLPTPALQIEAPKER